MRDQDEASPLTDQLSDYLLIVLNPALIMFMIGSLVFFLLHITYQGGFQGRIHYVFSLFVFAAVLIARISIESGSEKALPFGLALAAAVALVLLRFQLSGIATILFVALVWWCAHRLTWDCTVLDDQPEGPGEGLMKSLGMEEQQLVEHETDNATQPPANTGARSKSSWRAWVLPSEHTHAPGASVVWFAIAAIPIFGLGSVLAPSAITHRQYAFQLFCAYLASTLGLLLSTSLMGLRSYLRKRQLEISPDMVGSWLVHGVILIALLLILAAILPRPGAEYAVSQIPDLPKWRGEKPSTTKLAVGREGVHDPQRADRAGSADLTSGDPSEESSDVPQGEDESTGRADSATTSEPSRSPSSQSDSQGKTAPSANEKEGQPHPNRDTKSEPVRRPESPSSNSSEDRSDSSSDARRPSPDRHQTPPGRAPQPPGPSFSWGFVAALVQLVRGLAYLALAILVLYLAWRHRQLIVAALRDLYAAIVGFWNGLWDRNAEMPADEEAVTAAEPVRRFADCPDPFQLASAPPAAIVKATLEGLEAWASEHGSPRTSEQTLEEFARDLVRVRSCRPESIQGDLKVLVRLHDQVAYAGRRITREQVQPLRRLWATLQRHQAKLEPHL